MNTAWDALIVSPFPPRALTLPAAWEGDMEHCAVEDNVVSSFAARSESSEMRNCNSGT